MREWFAAHGWTPFPFQEKVWRAYPAGGFTGMGMVTPEPGEQVFVIADGEVLGVGGDTA